jgi:hypothetical protein
MKKRLPFLLPLIFIVTPLIIEILYLNRFAVNVPFWDHWAFVSLLRALSTKNSEWFLRLLWNQHNEHRLLFPRLVFLLLSKISNWNVVAEIYFSLFLACLSLIGLGLIYKKACRGSLWGFIPISWLVFSLGQWENILWGWQMQIYLQVLGLILGIYLLSSKTVKSTALAIVCGVIASFSFNSGLVIWPVGLLLLVVLRAERKCLALWGLAGALVITAYYTDYTAPTSHPSLTAVFSNPLIAVKFFLANVGSLLGGGDINLSMTMGACVIATLFVLLCKKVWTVLRTGVHVPESDITVGSLVLLSLLISAAITVGRVGFGLHAAIAPRYSTMSLLGIIGIYMLLTMDDWTSRWLDGKLGNHSLYPAFLSVLFVGLTMTAFYGVRMGNRVYADRIRMKYALETIDVQPDDVVKRLYHNPKFAREQAAFLKAQGINIFGDPASLPSAVGPSFANGALPDSAFKAQIALQEPFTTAQAGSHATIRVKVRNVGDVPWPALKNFDNKYHVRLGNHWWDDDGNLLVSNDGRTNLPNDLRPMEEIVLSLTVTIPEEPGNHVLELDMVQEEAAWFKDKGSETTSVHIQVK